MWDEAMPLPYTLITVFWVVVGACHGKPLRPYAPTPLRRDYLFADVLSNALSFSN